MGRWEVIIKAAAVGAVVATMVVCGQARAQAVMSVFGLGSDSCGTWLRHAQKEDAYDREAGIWLAGYLTANNQRLFATGLRATVGHGTDVDSGIAWIDQYCQAHPLKYVMEAAWALVRELEKTGR
jgi:hypothetical protein